MTKHLTTSTQAALSARQIPDQPQFREAMSRIASAVHVVTTDGPGGCNGATVSAVCSVTDDPPSVLACINRTSRVHAAILKNRVFCVNTLDTGQEQISDTFAGRGDVPMDERFQNHPWSSIVSGSPGFDGARLCIDCEVAAVTEANTHSVFIGTVIGLKVNEPGEPLLYMGRGYKTLVK